MDNQKKCIIWGTELQSMPSYDSSAIGYYRYDSLRAGGKYLVPRIIHDSIPILHEITFEEKIRLSGYIAKQNLHGKIPPPLDSIMEGENWLEKLPPIPNPDGRSYLLLKGLTKLYPNIGSSISLNLNASLGIDLNTKKNTLFLYALSYCHEEEEFQFLIESLEESKKLKIERGYVGGILNIIITSKGWEKVEKAENKTSSTNSQKAFIAMWIDDSMDDLKKCIKKAIENAGYEALRIDDKKHINKIDDEILNEINKARFMVCDLTSEKGKPRGSVYFEAGYAKGKDVPIIYTCSEELKKEMPFDIRQYKILFWNEDNMEHFTKELQVHIEADNVIGRNLKDKWNSEEEAAAVEDFL